MSNDQFRKVNFTLRKFRKEIFFMVRNLATSHHEDPPCENFARWINSWCENMALRIMSNSPCENFAMCLLHCEIPLNPLICFSSMQNFLFWVLDMIRIKLYGFFFHSSFWARKRIKIMVGIILVYLSDHFLIMIEKMDLFCSYIVY